MSQLKGSILPTRNGRSSISLRRLEAERLQEEGRQEPCESRDSRTDLWGTGGEIPPVYPAGKLELILDLFLITVRGSYLNFNLLMSRR